MTISTLTVKSIQDQFDDYINWLRDNTSFKEVRNDWVEITTPYLDRHNDCLQIFVQSQPEGFIFTDGAYIINDLEASGVQLNSSKRKKILLETLNGLGITLNKDNELIVRANKDNFAVKKNNLIQAMLAVNDMFALAHSSVASLFYEDVQMWLDESDIRYVPSASFKGKSGFDFKFDFVVPKHKSQPERFLQTINVPNKSKIEHLLFSWSDTKPARPDPENSKLCAIINDTEKQVTSSIRQSLENYDVLPILWSERHKYEEYLVA